jgi:hypothetical protein
MKDFVVSDSASESSDDSKSVVSLSSENEKEKMKPTGRLTRARRNGIILKILYIKII